jgi:hypothetical protein
MKLRFPHGHADSPGYDIQHLARTGHLVVVTLNYRHGMEGFARIKGAPANRAALLALVEPDERGDPMSPLRWTTKSLRTLAEELTRQGHPVSAPTVGRLLREQGFSLQANVR